MIEFTHRPKDKPLSLKSMSADEFAALGADQVVFVRPISAIDLTRLFPQFAGQSFPSELQLVVAADGAPVMVTDDDGAVADFIDRNEVGLATVH